MGRYDPQLTRQVQKVTCEDCPLRGSNPTGKLVGIQLLKGYIEAGTITIEEVEEAMVARRDTQNTIAQCGKLIISGSCTAYPLMSDQFYVCPRPQHPTEYPDELFIDDYTGQIIEE